MSNVIIVTDKSPIEGNNQYYLYEYIYTKKGWKYIGESDKKLTLPDIRFKRIFEKEAFPL